MRTVFYSGNPLVESDSIAARLASRLKREFPMIEFRELEPTESFSGDVSVIDCASGINEVKLVTDLAKLETSRPSGLHDFDLAWNLKLMQKLGIVKNVRIYAVPNIDDELAFGQLRELIRANEL
jgi:hypothetical protein